MHLECSTNRARRLLYNRNLDPETSQMLVIRSGHRLAPCLAPKTRHSMQPMHPGPEKQPDSMHIVYLRIALFGFVIRGSGVQAPPPVP